MSVPADYEERVYAGVLGKLIGVYLGRPFEGWTHARIEAELGEIDYYVGPHSDPVLTDDDISGTLLFARALPDHGNSRELTAQEIGETWLNYLVGGRTVIWWGGMGNSTEHTAYLRLKQGIPAPRSGSAELNGLVVAEQIGAQIFIDGWALVAPGDPELAGAFARRAASVSHDGEAVNAAVVIAAMEAQAFVESDIDRLLDTALAQIPTDCLVTSMIDQIRTWHASGEDWRATRRRIEDLYGYERYGGNCHVIPNHALIISALLHGGGDFQRSLMIVNTCGWDTDCNSGNLGCLLGIRGGLDALEGGPDWRGPVADRLYLPSADAGGAITDAVIEALKLAAVGRSLAGAAPLRPKEGARYSFAFPGSTQGFRVEHQAARGALVTLANVAGDTRDAGRSLAIEFAHLTPAGAARALVSTFIPDDAPAMTYYELIASPAVHPGQRMRAVVSAGRANDVPISCALLARTSAGEDGPLERRAKPVELAPGDGAELQWTVPDLSGQPIAAVGVEVTAASTAAGRLLVERLTWTGAPQVTLVGGPVVGAAQRAWVSVVDHLEFDGPEPVRLINDSGVGLIIQGGRTWEDYSVRATITPHMAEMVGLAARVQGLTCYYALLLGRDGVARLVKRRGRETTLAEAPVKWTLDRPYELGLRVDGQLLVASVDNVPLLDASDDSEPILAGAVAVLCEDGRMALHELVVGPASDASPPTADER